MGVYFIIVFVIFGLVYVIWDSEIGLIMRNKQIDVSNISKENIPKKYGEISQMNQLIKLRFIWTTKTKSYSDISQIKAYLTVNFGLENHFNHLTIYFKDKDSATLDPNRSDHKEFVDTILIELDKSPFIWEIDFASLDDENKRDIISESNS